MQLTMLSVDFFGAVSLMTIMYGAWFETKRRDLKQKVFMELVFAVFAAVVLDAISYFPVTWNNLGAVQFGITMFAMASPFVVYAIFLQYIYLHITGTSKVVSRKWFILGGILCTVGVIATVYYSFQGTLFKLQSTSHIPGEYYDGYLLLYVVILVYAMLVVLLNSRKIGFHDTFAAMLFMFVPLFYVFLNIRYQSLAFSLASLAISMQIINISLQGEHANDLIASEEATSKLAHSDELTGIANRLAFAKVCDNLDRNQNVGVIFADVNGLKYTNDHFGHKEGDALLCEFTNMLLGCFRRDDVFRISGDEFVVILSGMPEETFERKIRELREKIAAKDVPIASIGCVYGGGSEISRLIDMAETNMYEEKKEFHEKFPAYSRA